MKLFGIMLLLVGLGSVALATEYETAPVPEIDGASAVTAMCLVSGALLVATGRRKK